MKVSINTYGCTLNQADSDIVENILKSNGIDVEREGENSDILIINTCTVKTPTEQKIIEHIKRLKNKKLILMGCLASTNKEKLLRYAPNASIVTNANLDKIALVVEQVANGKQVIFDKFNLLEKPSLIPDKNEIIARIPISEGCLSNCTFCETKFARGPLHSFDEKLILKAIERSVNNGAKEIELTSQDIGAYGLDKKTNIAELLKRAIEINGDFKIRVGMLNPEHLHRYIDDLIEVMKSDKIYKFLHLPVQSGSNKVLADMKRNYTIEEFDSYIEAFRKTFRDITLATDIIVGYPTETDNDFDNTKELLERDRFLVVNISKFGPRPHAPASRLKQLENKIIKKRSIEIFRLVRRIQHSLLKQYLGSFEEVLITEMSTTPKGRDQYYRTVILDKGAIGEKYKVKIKGNTEVSLIGEAIDKI